jgi:hypothetical protein
VSLQTPTLRNYEKNFAFLVMRTRSSLFSVGVSPAPYASSYKGWEPRARATTLQSSQAQRRKRGRKAWQRRRRRRERRWWWWRPLASVRWRRRWWRQWTGRLGLEQLEQQLGEGWLKAGSGLLSLSSSRTCNCPSWTPPLDLPGPCLVPARPVPFSLILSLQDGPDSFPKTLGLRSFYPVRVSTGRNGCPFLRSALRLPSRTSPIIHRDVFVGWPVCVFLFLLLDWGTRLAPASPRQLRATAQYVPLPHPKFSGPAPSTEGRGPRNLEPVVAVWSSTVYNSQSLPLPTP